MLLSDLYMLLPDTSLYHLTSDVLPLDTWHVTNWNLPRLWYLSPACHVNAWSV